MSSKFQEDMLGKRILFFTGKGGVGKTLVALATAQLALRARKRVVFASWNEQDQQIYEEFFRQPNLTYLHLETLSAFREYVLRILKFDAIYNAVFENHVLKSFIQAAPGLSETVIGGKLWDLYSNGNQDTLIVDLPASGHAFSFFQSPFGVKRIFNLGLVHKEVTKIAEMFQSPSSLIHLVAIPEEMAIQETRELHQKLCGLAPLSFGHLIVNQCVPQFNVSSSGASSDPWESVKNDYALEKQSQEEALQFAKEVALPIIKVSRFPNSLPLSLIDHIATALGEK